MDLADEEDTLIRLARHLGIRTRREPFDPKLFAKTGQRGGLCSINRRLTIVLDSALTQVERVVLLSEALCAFDYEGFAVDEALEQRLSLARRRLAGKKLLRRPPLRRVV